MGISFRELAGPRPVPSAAVELRGMGKVYGLVPALVAVDLWVDFGEVVIVEGPNGAGKSTLLRMLATIAAPTRGSGRVLGFDLVGEREAIRRHTEYLGHRTRLYEDLTAAENLRFAARLAGVSHAKADEALGVMGLAGFARARVRGFSAGMRQRLALARLLLRRPRLMLLDEPFASLDADGRLLLERLLRAAADAGTTVMLVSHQTGPARFADRTLHLRDGRLIGA